MINGNMRRHAVCALLVRFLLVIYGDYRDRNASSELGMEPAYTDVDYWVFSDAARHVCRGESPYSRATYRYSPLLAWMLVPGCLLDWPAFGKHLFCVCDVVVGLMLWWVVSRDQAAGVSAPLVAACLWWYNLLPIGVASRGNGEAPALALVLAALGSAARARAAGAGALLALSTHLRLYPVILVPAFYLSLASTNHDTGIRIGERSLADWLNYRVWPNRARWQFVLAFSVCLSALTGLCYCCYGWDYFEHALIYHVIRRDVRHNFSVFFYMLYLTEDFGHRWMPLVTFMPQLVLICAISVRFHQRAHLPFACFCCVFVLVTFNKVYTSQYLLWYLSLLAACVPRLAAGLGVSAAREAVSRGVSAREAVGLLLLWYFAQGSWLLPAYLLEFDGRPVFRLVWAEGVALFCANVGILARLIRKYDGSECCVQGSAGDSVTERQCRLKQN